MARGKRYQPEQVVNLLRQIEVAVANGKTTARHARKRRSWSRRISAGARSMADCRSTRQRLKELEQENAKLKRLVANLSLDNLVLKDIARGNF